MCDCVWRELAFVCKKGRGRYRLNRRRNGQRDQEVRSKGNKRHQCVGKTPIGRLGRTEWVTGSRKVQRLASGVAGPHSELKGRKITECTRGNGKINRKPREKGTRGRYLWPGGLNECNENKRINEWMDVVWMCKNGLRKCYAVYMYMTREWHSIGPWLCT